MTEQRLKEKMLYQLQGFAKSSERDAITMDTIHKEVLGTSTGPTGKPTVYKNLVQLSCKLENTKLNPWPKEWLKTTINELAPELIDP